MSGTNMGSSFACSPVHVWCSVQREQQQQQQQQQKVPTETDPLRVMWSLLILLHVKSHGSRWTLD